MLSCVAPKQCQCTLCFHGASLYMSSFFCLVPQNEFGGTPLIAAGQENQLKVASVLLDVGATINYQNKVVNYIHCFIIEFAH